MSKSWKSVSAAEAAVHPLYGVKNWLVVFAIGVLFGLLREIGSLSGEALKAGISVTALLSVDHPATNFLKITLALETVAVAVIYFLLFTKHPQFRPVTTGLLLGLFPVVVLLGFLNPFDGLGSAIAMSFFSWAISCAVWVTYLMDLPPLILRSAKSVFGSVPITVASKLSPFWNFTFTESASATTWLLVTT